MADTDTPAPAPPSMLQRVAQATPTAVMHTGVAGGGIFAVKAFLGWFFICLEQGREHTVWFYIVTPDDIVLEQMAFGLILVGGMLKALKWRSTKTRRASDAAAA